MTNLKPTRFSLSFLTWICDRKVSQMILSYNITCIYARMFYVSKKLALQSTIEPL